MNGPNAAASIEPTLNVSNYHRSRTEPRPVARTGDFVQFAHVGSEIREQTDKQTETLIAILRIPCVGEVIINDNRT